MRGSSDPSKPKRIVCEHCKKREQLKPIWHRPYSRNENLEIPVWRCTRCEYNTASEILKAITSTRWDTSKDYSALVAEHLIEEVKT